MAVPQLDVISDTV